MPYLGLLVAAAFALKASVLLALAPLTAGFLLRTFIVSHDQHNGQQVR